MTKKPFIAKNGIVANGPTTNSLGTVTGNATLDLSTGNVFQHTPTANTTFVFSNPPASGTAYDFSLQVTGANVGTPYDLSGATPGFVESGKFSVASQESNPRSLSFSADGTRMYVLGDSGNDVTEYVLSTAWEVTTASFNNTFSVSAQESTPLGLFFKPDGTKMYVVGLSGNVSEYNLSVAGAVGTASYSQNFSVSIQQSYPTGVFFKPDGTKMYIVGEGGSTGTVSEYDLGTAWDVTTASHLQNFSVNAQDTNPSDLFFKSDGTTMYVVGDAGNDVNEYALGTAWDISTATYSQNFSVSAQETLARGIFFKSDGLVMYVIGRAIDAVFVYNLSTAWDVSTAAWLAPTTGYFQPSSEFESGAVSFKTDGTKMYILNAGADTVEEYDLSTAWDITTASYLQNFSVSAQDTLPKGFFMAPTGYKMYVVGSATDSVYEYSLATAWDVSTATYSTRTLNISAQETSPTGISFKPDGTKMYVVGTSSDSVNEYNLGTAWDLSTATYSQAFSVLSQTSSVNGVAFSADGTTMFISAYLFMFRYTLSTAWDVSTAFVSGTLSVPIATTNIQDVYLKSDGSSFFIIGRDPTAVFEYIMVYSPTYSYPASVSWLDASAPSDPADGEVLSLTFSTTDGGTTYYGAKLGASASGAALTAVSTSGANQTVNFDTTDIHVSTIDTESVTYTFSGANQVEALTLSLKNNILIPDSVPGTFPSYTADFTSQLTSVNGVGFKGDGTKAYLRGYTGTTHTIAQYSLSTAWDLRTATFDGLLSVALSTTTGENGVPLFKSDGTKMYTASNGYYQYSLTTPWDITSGVTADGLVHSASGADFSGDVKSDGTKFYSSVGSSGTLVAETILTTPWDFSTATTTEYSIMSAYTDLRGMSVIADGSKILLRGNRASFGYGIMLIDLTTPYDVSTRLTWDTAENYLGTVPNTQGISTDSTDTYMYLGGSGVVEVYTINGIPSLTFPTSIVNASSISVPDYQSEVNIDLFTYDGGTSYHLK